MIRLLLIVFPLSSWGAQVTEAFTSSAQLESGTAVWNQALGKIHSSLRVMNYKGGYVPLAVDVGDGSMGSFDLTTYSKFSVGGDLSGNIIRLSTSQYPILKVTNFTLEAGWKLVPQGNLPLKIFSQGTVSVRGEIWCHGDAGTDAVNTTPGSGGQGRCGGAAGGNGGVVTGPGAKGEDATITTVTGGLGGHYSGGVAVGGGGGGSWNSTSLAGNGPNFGAGGVRGTSVADPEFIFISGGAGGGGGSGTPSWAGGGGGGGGGTVIIHAVGDFNLGTTPNSVTGFIYANGGAGGSSNVPGGPGGGGGGGSVQVFSGGTINIFNTNGSGASRAGLGSGGTNSLAAVGASGGPGRSWFSSVAYNGIGFYAPAEQAPVSPGNVEFTSASQELLTKSYDLGTTLGALQTLSPSPVSNDFQIQLSGSSDNFANDNTGWTSNLASLAKKRFIKMKISVSASNVNTPTMLDSVTLAYAPGVQDEFEFKSTGCGIVDGDVPPSARGLMWAFLIIPLLAYSWLRRKAKNDKNF